ncbi:MAG: FxsA family protein [Gammaproteobacteria bacterium]|nr:FxsA family protein [Gammaproteobacteria bacterium]MDH5651877.1 FxsA family protein [Gammaproteobacteria bacterium]
MFKIFFILFLTVPLLEIFLLIKIGGQIGAGWTVFLVVFTAVLGAFLLRMQGISTLRRLQECSARGELPAIPLVEGAFLIIAGALLMTPGFFTDTVGFLLLIPPIRQQLAVNLINRGVWAVRTHHGGQSSPSSGTTHTIEGEYERKDD